jgi:hypothetical protein
MRVRARSLRSRPSTGVSVWEEKPRSCRCARRICLSIGVQKECRKSPRSRDGGKLGPSGFRCSPRSERSAQCQTMTP